MDRLLIDQYETGGDLLRKAIAGLSKEDLLWAPPADAGIGLWSIQQIVLHLMDADLIGAFRMKSIIVEDNPLMLAWDENKFTANLCYAQQNAENAALILDLNRKQFTKVLRKLADSTFSRTGRHSERGVMTLEKCLQINVDHVNHHLKFIRQKREKLGKALKV
jgi:uncharacterized damage-inducible protein DinB